MTRREEQFDAVDACIFTGDTLHIPEELEMVKRYLERWNKAVADHENNEDFGPVTL